MSAPTIPAANPSPRPAGHRPPLPPNISRENAQQQLEQWQSMKQAGQSKDNQEYTHVEDYLEGINDLYASQRVRGTSDRGLDNKGPLSQLQSLQQNGDTTHQDPPAPKPTAPNGMSPHMQAENARATSSAAPTAVRPPWMTDAQRALLRNQMKAFQLLTKNMPLPPEIQRLIFPSQQAKSAPGPNELLDEASQALNGVARENDPENKLDVTNTSEQKSSDKQEITRKLKLTSPWAEPFMHRYIDYAAHSRRSGRPHIPSIMPAGVDPDRVREDRETIVYNRIKLRKEQLAETDPNLATWNSKSSDLPQPDGSRKLRALLEYKKLNLLEKQRNLRHAISREMLMGESLAMTGHRAYYRRQKKHDIREARFTEQLERDQRSARENKEKQKHVAWLNQIKSHAQEVRMAANEQNDRIKRLGRLMMDQHKTIEKEEQKRIERTARQRLQALKANDEETYLKLLGQAKDSRISHLLKQTDGFLNQLAASVKAQQRAANDRWGRREEIEEESESEEDIEGEDEEGERRIDYYEVAHKIKEEVKQQSSNLVGGTLKEYQLRGLQWMISLYNNNLNGILADEMGLGKTIQTISLITYLMEMKRQNGPFLVVVPLSTLTNWNNEFEKWAPSVTRIVYKGSPPVRKTLQNQIRYGNWQVLLTTYEFVIKDRPILSKVKWLHMIVDEGHRMKNANSKLSSTITQYYTTRYRIILTGTPLQNNLPELWALLNFVLPTIFKSVKSFDEWFNTPFANTGGQDKMELTEEESLLVIRRLHKVLRPFLLRRLKRDVEKDLPDKQERVIKCSFSALQFKLHKQLSDHNKLMISDGRGGKTGMRGLSNMLMQMRKLCNHPFVFEEVEDQFSPERMSNDLLWRSAGKFELLDRILPKFRATGHRVLMFFQMTQIMNIMEDFMRYRQFSYLRLDGSTKSDERAELLRQFNAEDSPYFCFLLSTRAGGLGLNLQTADTVIIFDSDWNPHQDLQAQDRAHRIGQKNEVRILRLITSNSVEEKILERAQWKLDMDGKVIQAGKFDHKSTNEERDAMLRIMFESAEAAETQEDEEIDDEDLNMLIMRSDDELEAFQKIDEEREKNDPYGPNKKFPRLLSEEELPEIYLSEDVPTVEEVEEYAGRGARERTRVRYDDGLTEEQWLEAVDNDEDPNEAAARKAEKIARRQANKEKRSRLDNGAPDSPIPSRDSSESPVPKKRGRKPKRKMDEISADGDNSPVPSSTAVGPPAKKQRGRQNKPVETLGTAEREALQGALDVIYETVEDLQEPIPEGLREPGEEGGMRPIIDPFLKLPDRKMYADYYQFIRDPICMEQILKRINEKRYHSLDHFAKDMKLLVDNCRLYNDDESILFKDANTIEAKTLELLRAENAARTELGAAAFHEDQYLSGGNGLGPSFTGGGAPSSGAPDSVAADGGIDGSVDGMGGTGTGAVSTPRSGTPGSGIPNGGGGKIKLNFGPK